ncbi:hypothetical protein WSM22_36430 [Cytophagales bacterium WSM2-2]|nr:hypothetical protein WSM22_36430 [Cytophagales bacterium WSM2-2]
MKKIYIAVLILFVSHFASAQGLTITGKQFFALTVSNVDSTSRWYEQTFSMKLVKEVKLKDNNLYVRILTNDFLLVELLQMDGTKSLRDCSIPKGDGHLMRGLVKIGFYVPDLIVAEKYFRSMKVKFRYDPFDDKEMKVRAFLLEDPNGNLIQVMQSL